jgi:hypothetical protein
MSMQANQWRVNGAEGIFETDLETLKTWVADGRVLPTDMVSKGTLNPIEARRVPALRSIFDCGSNAPQIVEPVAKMPPPPPPVFVEDPFEPVAEPAQFDPVSDTPPIEDATAAPQRVCHYHPEVAAQYVCRVCTAEFCDQCPEFVTGNSVAHCALCGNTCNRIETAVRITASREVLGDAGFGVADLSRAFLYPFQHKFVLLFGAVVYGLFQLAGFWGRLAAYVLMFGCITRVISQVAWGRIAQNFMPDFSEFELWDDLAVPVALGVGITIVTLGPTIFLVLVLVLGFGAGRSSLAVSPSAEAQSSGLTKEDLSTLADPNADGKKLEEANKKLNQIRPGHELNQEAEKSKEENSPFASWRLMMLVFGGSVVMVLLLLLTLAWALFYYPMALAVAGYTESFGAVINPMVGIDTIRRMGSTYFKAFGMVLGIQAISFVVAVVVAVVTAPFVMPFIGNLPGTFIQGSFTFYFNLVIACLLGLSLYKCGDRLGIEAD